MDRPGPLPAPGAGHPPHEPARGPAVSAARIGGDPASAVREERTSVGGRSMRYLTSGEGPPLVLVHALGENALDWSWVQPALSRDYRVYPPDLPGIVDGIAADCSSTYFASFLAAYLDA